MNVFDLFISHSSRRDPDDHELIDALAKALQRRNLRIFVDRLQLKKGQELLSSLDEAMSSSLLGLVVLTRKAVASGWVDYELDVMRRQCAIKRMRILVLRLDSGCTVPRGIRIDDVIDITDRHDITGLADKIVSVIRDISQLREGM
jgi:hypothetical protein